MATKWPEKYAQKRVEEFLGRRVGKTGATVGLISGNPLVS
jgi:hypothetical protein